MSGALIGVRGLRVSAALVAGGALLSGPVSMLIVTQLAPQPAWTTVEAFGSHYHALQTLPYLLLGGFVLFAASCHAIGDERVRARTSAALVFTGVYAALVFTNYTIQLGFIPRVLATRPAYIADLTMSNPSSFAWFLEMFGYAAMGVATWLVSPMFGGGGRGRTIQYLLIGNGVLSVVGAMCTAMFDRWVFSAAGFVSFAGWNVLIVACYLLIAISPDGGVRPVKPTGSVT